MTGSTGLDFSDYIADRTLDFTGREWVLARIETWLADPDGSRAFLLVGGPGTGKSAILARLAQFSLGQVVADGCPHLAPGFLNYHHFCQAQQDATLNPVRFVEALSRALGERYPAFVQALVDRNKDDQRIIIKPTIKLTTAADGSVVKNLTIENLNVGNISARKAFDQTVRQPLEVLCREGGPERIVILVDSLDEACTWREEENLLTLLAETLDDPRDLPPQVRFVLACRRDERVLADLGLPPSLDLIADAPSDAQEARAYASVRLAKAPLGAELRDQLAARLAESSMGNFLYARYVLDDWLARPEEISLQSALDLPVGLSGIYLQFLKRELTRDKEEWEERYQPLLGLLAVARGEGLTLRHLVAASGLQPRQIDNALRACGPYLVGPRPEGPLRIYHQSFRDFLLTDKTYPIYAAEAHQALGTFFLEEHEGAWLDCQDGYALEHTPAHLTEAVVGTTTRPSRQALGEQLVGLLADFDYLEAKTSCLKVTSLLTDLRGAVEKLAGYDQVVDAVSPLLKALNWEAANLSGWDRAQDTAFFAQQVRNRAVVLGLAGLASQATARLGHLKRPHLQLLWSAPLGPVAAEPPEQGRVELIRTRAFTPFGRWPVRIAYAGPAGGGYHMRGRLSISPKAAALTLSTPSRRWKLTVPRDGSPLPASEATTYDIKQDVGSVSPGGVVRCVDIHKFCLSDPDHFAREWAPHVTQMPVAMTPDGAQAIAALQDGRLRVLDAGIGQEQAMLAGHAALVTALAVSADGRWLVSGALDGTLKAWALAASPQELALAGHTSPVTALAIFPTGDALLSASADGILKIWDLASGHERFTLAGHGDAVHAVAVTRDGQLAISASADRTLKLWDLACGSEIAILHGHDEPVLAVALTPDGHRAVSGSEDGTLKVWNLALRQVEHTLRGHSDAVHTVLVTPDGARVISASDDGTLRLWELETGREAGKLDTGSFAARLLLDGTRVAAVDWWSSRLAVWDATAPAAPGPLALAVMDHELGYLAWAADGVTLLTGDELGGVYCFRYAQP